MARWISIIALGLGGLAILLSLGVWQLQRLAWKTEMLDRIETRIAGPAEPLPVDPDPEAMRFRPVAVEGSIAGAPLHVLTSTAETGPGYRVIAPFETTTGRAVMVDLGVIPTAAKDAAPDTGPLRIEGNLHWPRESDGFTPPPEAERNIWYARDVPMMAEALGTEPILVVARGVEPPLPGILLQPVGTAAIANDHLQYAITWFTIAAGWAGMTLLLLWRMARSDRSRTR
ncbi:SURF1 family protein [Palleronia sediminis]|uniref:SURF1-like protein n=1 Tax=Palleronia sediminis TaxID=2547833 RepID=A0A4R6A0W1_9RHOB|nr:SURF1 family protein [Palleronia sediminis]TDL76295.1 SURF1 family protein [Palleronia sediminis]